MQRPYYAFLLLLFSLAPVHAAPVDGAPVDGAPDRTRALQTIRAEMTRKDFVKATAAASEALKQYPADAELLGLFGVACMQTFQCLPYAFEVWQKALAAGASIRVPGYRLHDIRAGFNPWKAIRTSLRYERTPGALIISRHEVFFDAAVPEKSFRMPLSELGIGETPGPMAVKDPSLIGYDGAEHGEGTLFFIGRINGRKVEIPVNLEGASRIIVSGEDLRRSRQIYENMWDSITWRIGGTARLAYAAIHTAYNPDWPSRNKLEGEAHRASRADRPRYGNR